MTIEYYYQLGKIAEENPSSSTSLHIETFIALKKN